jgi:paraquat-inducible protein B
VGRANHTQHSTRAGTADRMSEAAPPPPPPPAAAVHQARFSLVWLIPVIAAIIAGYLGYRTFLEQGPLMTLTFDTAEGLAAGQTQVKYKAVALGTVESIDLGPDHSNVVVKVRMNSVGARFLTSHARFWVVRPRFNLSDVASLDTLLSGAYISVDPGAPGGTYLNHFTGLEQPPGVRSDEPGRTYVLTADNLGTLTTGSPVYYRDVQVGEVLGYDLGNGLGPAKISIFVRAPYDNLVRPESRFWNSSGIAAAITGGVLQIQMQSLEAVIAGGVTFSLPPEAVKSPPSPNNASFTLYASHQEAEAATYQWQIPVVSYLTTSVSGLTPGAPVDMLGIQVGDVTSIQLQIDRKNGKMTVRVGMQLQPERVFNESSLANVNPGADFQLLVNHGMRVEIGTESYVTGQKLIALTMEPGAPPVPVTREGNAYVLPSQPSNLDITLASLSAVSAQLAKIPFKQLGDNLNKLLVTANGTLGGSQMKQTLNTLDNTLQNTNATVGSLNQTYGSDSDFQRSVAQVLQQANDALSAIKQLADYLNRHPQAILLGRSNAP